LLRLDARSRGMLRKLLNDLGDPTRFEIIGLLREKPMTLDGLSEKLGKRRQTIEHHVRILMETSS
jgi:DNA-binding transcriptional ArsR family regulator